MRLLVLLRVLHAGTGSTWDPEAAKLPVVELGRCTQVDLGTTCLRSAANDYPIKGKAASTRCLGLADKENGVESEDGS